MSIDPTKLCQIEIQVRDLDRSILFYQNVLGWHPIPAEIHRVTVLEVPEHCAFGISLIGHKTRHSAAKQVPWSPLVLYFAHDKPQEIIAKVPQYLGRVRFGPKQLPGYGEIFQFMDPDGTRFGLFQANR